MKKIIVLFVLSIGLMSFSNSSTLKIADENIVSNNISESDVSTEYLINYNLDIEDALFSCRATITYNGTPVASTTGFGATAADACANARLLARLYIFAQGGTPPN